MKQLNMLPLDERLIDDEVISVLMNLIMRLAHLEESFDFCQD